MRRDFNSAVVNIYDVVLSALGYRLHKTYPAPGGGGRKLIAPICWFNWFIPGPPGGWGGGGANWLFPGGGGGGANWLLLDAAGGGGANRLLLLAPCGGGAKPCPAPGGGGAKPCPAPGGGGGWNAMIDNP